MQFFNVFKCKSSYTVRWCLVHICRPHLPKVLRACHFFKVWNANRIKTSSCHSPVHFLPTTFSDRGADPQKQTPHFGDERSHITRKNTRFCAQNIFNPWIHAFPNCYSAPTRELLLLTICCHDAGLPFVRKLGSFLIKLPVVILYVWYISRVVISSCYIYPRPNFL